MNYIGSKYKLLPFLYNNISDTLASNDIRLEQCVFADLFAGTCAVSKFFKTKVKQILANDKEFYSFVLAKNYIENTAPISRARELLTMLNTIDGIQGKIYRHYALGGGENRQYFSDSNAMKIDAIRTQISQWHNDTYINEQEYYFLLASLLESADKVANTACVYGAFLKTLKKTAAQELRIDSAKFDCTHTTHQAFQANASEIIEQICGDVLYLDPPYNAREYGANYHLLNTIALYDDFTPKGKTGLREYKKSAWCKKNAVPHELETIIRKANFRFIFLSYNDEGLLGIEEIERIFSRYGTYRRVAQAHHRFKADSNRPHKQNATIEYLHILEKQ